MPSHRIQPLLAVSLLSSLATATVGFDCSNIVSQKVRWDLHELGGPRMVHWLREGDPVNFNYTFTLDICRPLRKRKGDDSHEACPSNTRVCGVDLETNWVENKTMIHEVVPIAGDYHLTTGNSLESEVFRLKDSGSNSDSDKEGIRVELSGGRANMNKKDGKKQKAIIEFLCDPDRDGKDTEVDERPEEPEDEKKPERKRRDEEKQKEKSLKFLSYKDEKVKDEDWGVLRLEWKSMYACEDAVNIPKESGAHWGFFTWMIIIIFLGTSSYLIFGSWLNYNRYGARGWDALPHGDTLRELPYIVGDLGRKVTNTIQTGGSRGGYSAV